MKTANLLLIFLLALSFTYAGCKSGEDQSEGPVEEIVEEIQEKHEEMVEEVDKTAPPKLAAELWGLIHTEGYKEHWKIAPGTDAFADAGDGKLTTTYLNDLALKAEEKGEDMPPGSMVVTENYDMEKELQSISLKANVVGYDKDDGWFKVTYDPGGNPISYE